MAILLDFEKVREDRQKVEYIFGYPAMDRRLVIQKATGQGRPMDGQEDGNYAAVFVKILRFHRSEARWPLKGSYAA
ncbi:hypothetical protein JNW88_23250 [Micromonospora sp. ATA32]|nr:hypothetical protein [Micromonospora sp. ATA32]